MNVHYATNIRLRAWIHVALRPIRFPLTRRTLRREFSDHFEDCRDAMLDRGLSERDADEKALESLGNASQTAKLLRLVYRPRIYAVRAAIILLVLLLRLPWPTHITQQMYGRVYEYDGTVTEISFAVKGWKLDYLVRDDKLKLEVIWDESVDQEALFPQPLLNPQEVLGYGTPGLYWDLNLGYWNMGFGEWVPSPDLFEKSCLFLRGNLDLSYDCQSCMITCGYGDCRWYILAADSPYADEAQLRSLFIQPLKSYQEYVEYWRTPWDER